MEAFSDDLYERLGLENDCSQEEIKAAYRRAASRFHPDKGGEDASDEAFHSIRAAYVVLKDRESRRRYDETGDYDDGVVDVDSRALEVIATCIKQYIDDPRLSPENSDYLQCVKESIQGALIEGRQQQQHNEGSIRRYRAAKRFFVKAGRARPNIFHQVLDAKIRKCEDDIDRIVSSIKVMGRSLEILEDFEIEIPEDPAPPSEYPWATTTGRSC